MSDKVLDFEEKRKQNIEEKRQGFERLMFQNILGAYTVIDKAGTVYPIKLIDISHDGCMFQVPWNPRNDDKFENDTEIKLKFYFSEKSFVPAIVKIRYAMETIEGDGQTSIRYGCEFDKSLKSFEALKSFIEFLYKFAELSTIDHSENRSFFL